MSVYRCQRKKRPDRKNKHYTPEAGIRLTTDRRSHLTRFHGAWDAADRTVSLIPIKQSPHQAKAGIHAIHLHPPCLWHRSILILWTQWAYATGISAAKIFFHTFFRRRQNARTIRLLM